MLKQIITWQTKVAVFLRGRLDREDRGASLVEYALLLALIAVVAIGALTFLGGTVSNSLNHVANNINSTTGP